MKRHAWIVTLLVAALSTGGGLAQELDLPRTRSDVEGIG